MFKLLLHNCSLKKQLKKYVRREALVSTRKESSERNSKPEKKLSKTGGFKKMICSVFLSGSFKASITLKLLKRKQRLKRIANKFIQLLESELRLKLGL